MEASKKLLEEWKPRIIGSKTLQSEFEKDSPEFIAVSFLNFIINKNYGSPTEYYSENFYKKVSKKEKAGKFRKEYSSIIIKDYIVTEIKDLGASLSEISIDINYEKNNVENKKNIVFRMIYELNGEIENRLVKNGKWKIVNIEALVHHF